MTSNRPTPAYPTALQVEISHSTRFARALRTLEVPIAPDLAVTARDEEEAAEDGASLWLEGRAEEVAVFTADVLRAWSSGELELNAAVRVIREYVQALQAALEEWYAPSSCGPFTGAHASGVLKVEPGVRRYDPLLDTMADAPPSIRSQGIAAAR